MNINFISLCKLIASASLLISAAANANLITNGGFEDTTVNNGNGGWQWYNSANVNGWSGSNIEIWNNFGAIGAYEGAQHAELNAHPSNGQAFSIFQTFNTNVGSSYDLFFAYGARKNNNEAFRVDVVGLDSIISQVITDHTVNNWSTFSNSFVANSTQTTLRFTAVTPSTGTVGNFLDDIQVTSVPEPQPLALLSLSLFALLLRRKKNA